MRELSPVRGLFIVVVVYVATLIPPIDGYIAINIVLGLALALITVAAETRLRAAALTDLLGGVIGFFVALTIAKTISTALFWADTTNPLVQFMHGLIIVVLPYLGLVVGTRKGEWLEPAKLASLFREARPQKRYKILDTSVIIDGRIADIVETGFLDGTLVVPQFVLKELQYVADSSDALKRNRGRRGLDILHRIRKMAGVEVVISDVDFPNVKEVDLKLIELARTMMGRIVTNDFNLNKVAQLRGVDVLNINELANSLKTRGPAGRGHERLRDQGRQGIQPGCGLPGRRHHGGRGQCAQSDRQEPRHRRHERAPDDRGAHDLRTPRGAGDGACRSGPCVGRGRPAFRSAGRRRTDPPSKARRTSVRPPPFHWWRTVGFLIPAVTLYTVVLGTLSFFSSLADRSGEFAHRCAQWWARAILATTGVRVERRGADPAEHESCIFVVNHSSIYDIPILFTAIPRQLRIIAKATLGYVPFVGWHLRRSGHLLVDRRNPGAGDLQEDAADGRSGHVVNRLSRRGHGHATAA